MPKIVVYVIFNLQLHICMVHRCDPCASLLSGRPFTLSAPRSRRASLTLPQARWRFLAFSSSGSNWSLSARILRKLTTNGT